MPLLIAERLWEIRAHQCCFQSEHVGAYLVPFRISMHSTCLCLDNKAAPAIASNINIEFYPDDNYRLIVHEYSGLEPGDTQGLRAILDFISKRTDPSRPATETLDVIW